MIADFSFMVERERRELCECRQLSVSQGLPKSR